MHDLIDYASLVSSHAQPFNSMLLALTHACPDVAYCEHGKHCLCNVEGMHPVVVGHRTVVLLHCQQPPVKHLYMVTENMPSLH